MTLHSPSQHFLGETEDGLLYLGNDNPIHALFLSEALKNLLPAGESAEKLTQVSGFIQMGMVLLRIRERLWPRKKQG